MLIALLSIQCASKKTYQMEGYIYVNDSTPADKIQIYYPIKIDRASWIYNELTETNNNGLYQIKDLIPAKSSVLNYANQSKDSLYVTFFITQNKDIEPSKTKLFPKKIELKVQKDSILKMDTIFLNSKN